MSRNKGDRRAKNRSINVYVNPARSAAELNFVNAFIRGGQFFFNYYVTYFWRAILLRYSLGIRNLLAWSVSP